jgi:hypothetical protein
MHHSRLWQRQSVQRVYRSGRLHQSQIAKARIKTRQRSKEDREIDSLRSDVGTSQEDREVATYSPFDRSFIAIRSLDSNSASSLAGKVVKEQKEPAPRPISANRLACIYAKRDARILIGRLEELSERKLEELALQIAVRNPQSRLRNRTADNVTQNETEAILDAMANEAQLTSVTMAEAGRTILGLLDAWDHVPREKWKLVASIPEFYRQGGYRLQPKELPGHSSRAWRLAR